MEFQAITEKKDSDIAIADKDKELLEKELEKQKVSTQKISAELICSERKDYEHRV